MEMLTKLFIVPILFFATASFAQVTFQNPASVFKPNGYSHSAIVDLGNVKMVLVAGQVPLDENGRMVGKNDMAAQAEQVFANIKAAVQAAGGTMLDVVKLNYFVRDVSQVQKIRDVRDKYINVKNPPASTLVEVSNLFLDDLLLEIEATAIIPKNR